MLHHATLHRSYCLDHVAEIYPRGITRHVANHEKEYDQISTLTLQNASPVCAITGSIYMCQGHPRSGSDKCTAPNPEASRIIHMQYRKDRIE